AGRLLRWSLIVLFAVPALNYAATSTVIELFDPKSTAWLVINSLNGGALLLAFGIYAAVSIGYPFAGKGLTEPPRGSPRARAHAIVATRTAC
ncbi:MAG: hypothetical protein ACREQL_05290, partial [Candidatus Binatia bacterium]